ncbi:MAG: hypothetical protein QXG00_00260 [Candidatus Woesearchaeota archaeon]
MKFQIFENKNRIKISRIIKNKINKKINKRAALKEPILNIFRIFFLIFAIGIFIWIIVFFVVNNLDVSSLHMDVIFNKIYYSPNIINYVDENTGRVYPGIIDIKKFTRSNIEKSLNFRNVRVMAVKLELTDSTNNKQFGPIYNNQYYYKSIEVQSNVFKNDFNVIEKNVSVLYIENNIFNSGILNIKLISEK